MRASKHGVFTDKPGTLSNDFFVNLLDMRTSGSPPATTCTKGRTARRRRAKWTGTRVDLIFGSHSQLRAIAEVYACADSQAKFAQDFAAAWAR
jgi:catalase-peroxidase